MRLYNSKNQHIGFVKATQEGYIVSIFPSAQDLSVPGELINGGHYRHFAMTERTYEAFKEKGQLKTEEGEKQPDIFDFMTKHM